MALTDAEIEQLEQQSAQQTPLTDEQILALESQYKQQEPSLVDILTNAKNWFGEGPQPGMPFSQGLRRLGESTAAGGLIGGAIGSIVPGPGTLGGAAMGALGGALGELGEQAAAEMGLERGGQVLTGAAFGAPVGLADAAFGAGRNVLSKGLALVPGTKGFALRRLADEFSKETGLDPSVREAVLAAQQQLARGGEQASREFGEAARIAVAGEKETFESAAEQARKRAEEFAGQFNKAASQREATYYQQAEQANKQLADTLEQGIGKGSSVFDLGNKIRRFVAGINEPALAKRSADYQSAADTAMTSARSSEQSGNFWGQTPEAQAVLQKWKDRADRSSKDVKDQINSILNDIWQKTPIKNDLGETTGMKESYLSAEGIDQWIRRLGEAYTKELQGYSALKGSIAKELRHDITQGVEGKGGFYDWSGLGEAKQLYKNATEDLLRFESKRGEALLGKQFGTDFYRQDAESVAKTVLGSESGVQDFLRMVRDPKIVSTYLDDYVRGQLRGKSPQQVEKWMNENSYVEKYLPNIRQEVTDYVGKTGILERQANQFTSAAKAQTKQMVSPFVTKSAEKYVDSLGVFGAEGKMMDANKILDNILSSKFSEAKMQEVGRLIGDQPGMKQNMLNAVALRLSKVSPTRIMAEFDALEPAIRGFGNVSNADIAMMRNKMQQVATAAQKKPSYETGPSVKQALLGLGARGVGRSILRPAITGRIDTEKDQNELRP